MGTVINPFWTAGGAGPLTATFIGYQLTGGAGSTVWDLSFDLGVGQADSMVVCAIGSINTATAAVTDLVIDPLGTPQSSTVLFTQTEVSAATGINAMTAVNYSTGGVKTLRATFSAAAIDCHIAVWVITGSDTAIGNWVFNSVGTAVTYTLSVDLNISADNLVIGSQTIWTSSGIGSSNTVWTFEGNAEDVEDYEDSTSVDRRRAGARKVETVANAAYTVQAVISPGGSGGIAYCMGAVAIPPAP